jgi:predicted DNA-binding ribbon-helix-helix protein
MTPAQVQQNQLKELYESDFCLWAEHMAQLLRQGKFAQLDLDNLIEEVEDMSGSQKRALLSNLRVLLLHLLKYKYQPNKRTQSWRSSIIEHRLHIQEAFEESPSLKPYFLENFDKAYQKARKQASLETELPIQTFSQECPFPMESVLADEWMSE